MATTDFADCQTIIRAFEKGCAYSTDERSVFALSTPFLQDTMMMGDASDRLVRKAYEKKISTIDNEISQELGVLQERMSTGDTQSQFTKSQQTASQYMGQSQGMDFTGTDSNNIAAVNQGASNDKTKAWLLEKAKECIPCDLRIMSEDIKNYEWGAKLSGAMNGMLDQLDTYWRSVIERIMDLVNMFRNTADYIDICAFVNWMHDFVCVPDLYKIMAALSALMIDVCGFLDGFGIDLVLGLVAPLLMPSLQALVSVLTDFLSLVLKPLECIIDSLEKIMRKLDMSSFRLPSQVTVRAPAWVRSSGSEYWTSDATRDPQSEHELGVRGQLRYPSSGDLKQQGTWNFDKSIQFSNNEDYARDASVFHKYDMPDLDQQLKVMREAADWTSRLNTHLQTMFGDLIYFLHAAIGRFEKMIQDVLGELQKLIQEYVLGYSLNMQRAATQKLGILQLLKVVSFFINLSKLDTCKEERADAVNAAYVTQALSTAQGYTAYQDENGNVHIEEPDEVVQVARDILGSVITDPTPVTEGQSGERRQTVFSSADPVMSAKLADIVEKITTPVKVVFGCSFDISAADVDRYNAWMLGT